MRKSFGLCLSFFLIAGSLFACDSPMDPEVRVFLNELNYRVGFEKINEASYSSTQTFFENSDFSGEIGSIKSEFYINRTDREKQQYSLDTKYDGNQIKPIQNGALNSLGLVENKVTGEYEEKDDSYKQTFFQYGKDSQGNIKEDSSSEFISSITYINKLTAYLFGDESTNSNGLYYGNFLQTQSRQFASFMSVDKENNTLTFDPKPTGVNPKEQKYIDYKLTVNDMGMLLSYEATSYDGDNKIYSKYSRTCSYK